MDILYFNDDSGYLWSTNVYWARMIIIIRLLFVHGYICSVQFVVALWAVSWCHGSQTKVQACAVWILKREGARVCCKVESLCVPECFTGRHKTHTSMGSCRKAAGLYLEDFSPPIREASSVLRPKWRKMDGH